MNVLFIHNIVAPYRTFLFEELSKLCNLKVIYLNKNDNERLWDQSTQNHKYDLEFIEGKKIKLFGKKISINFNLLKYIKLGKSDIDIVVLLDDPENIITMFIALIYAKIILKKRIILISPRFKAYITSNDSVLQGLMKRAIDAFRIPMYFLADKIWCYSEETKSLIGKYVNSNKLVSGFQGYPKELLDCSVDCFPDYIEKFKSNNFLFLGYINNRKGLNILFDAFEIMHRNDMNISLTIVGDGDLYDFYNDKYASDRIKFVGYKSGSEKLNYIKSAKFVCLPSHSDSWGWVIQEAQEMSTPVITTSQVVASETCPVRDYIYNSTDVYELVSIFNKIMVLSYDDYKLLCDDSYNSAQMHTLDKTIKSFKNILGTFL
jgi:glycosyltransferase involved in cell wall biosynthesis